jgi:hypothetical protein
MAGPARCSVRLAEIPHANANLVVHDRVRHCGIRIRCATTAFDQPKELGRHRRRPLAPLDADFLRGDHDRGLT